MSLTFEQQAAQHGLRQLFSDSYFSVCKLEAALAAVGLQLPRHTQAAMRAVHCMHYADMTPEFRCALFERVLQLFQLEPFDLGAVQHLFTTTPVVDVSAPEAATAKGLFRRLISS